MGTRGKERRGDTHNMPPKGSKKGAAKAGKAKKGVKKAKKIKDPNAPKRPMSAYFLFMNATRASVKKENPDYGIGDVAKALGKLWGEISPSDKSKFEKEAAIAKKKWEAEKAAYAKKAPKVVEASEDEEDEEEAEDSE